MQPGGRGELGEEALQGSGVGSRSFVDDQGVISALEDGAGVFGVEGMPHTTIAFD